MMPWVSGLNCSSKAPPWGQQDPKPSQVLDLHPTLWGTQVPSPCPALLFPGAWDGRGCA